MQLHDINPVINPVIAVCVCEGGSHMRALANIIRNRINNNPPSVSCSYLLASDDTMDSPENY